MLTAARIRRRIHQEPNVAAIRCGHNFRCGCELSRPCQNEADIPVHINTRDTQIMPIELRDIARASLLTYLIPLSPRIHSMKNLHRGRSKVSSG
jgi:hypothetical protein